MTSGVALVTTVWLGSRDTTSLQVDVLNAFLLYHISIGIDRILVFFDGDATQQPTRASLHADVQSLVAQKRIELFYRCASMEAGDQQPTIHGARSADGCTILWYADCVNYEKLRGAITSDVASRQMLHAALAMRLLMTRNHSSDKVNDKTRWLLHLDVDELFYCEGMASSASAPATVLRALLDAVEAERPAIDQLTVVNYEAVPTTKYGGNYFAAATHFRRHTARIPMSSESQQAMRDWQNKSPFDQFFLFYDNGKSLVRVPEGIRTTTTDATGVVPASVHHWRPHHVNQNWRSVSNFYDPRRTDVQVWREPQPRLRCSVLHFPVCGLEWLVEKYARLGSFPDVWGGTLRTSSSMKIPPCFHLDARDASRRGGEKELERLYEAQVMVSSTSSESDGFWPRQLRSGVCEEITFARELLVAKGFESLVSLESKEETTAIVSATPVTSDDVLPPTPSNSTAHDPTGLTVQKAWMLAAISEQYLS